MSTMFFEVLPSKTEMNCSKYKWEPDLAWREKVSKRVEVTLSLIYQQSRSFWKGIKELTRNFQISANLEEQIQQLPFHY